MAIERAILKTSTNKGVKTKNNTSAIYHVIYKRRVSDRFMSVVSSWTMRWEEEGFVVRHNHLQSLLLHCRPHYWWSGTEFCGNDERILHKSLKLLFLRMFLTRKFRLRSWRVLEL